MSPLLFLQTCDCMYMSNAAITSQFRSLLQAIVCERFADESAALAAIDTALESGTITVTEARKLEAAVTK